MWGWGLHLVTPHITPRGCSRLEGKEPGEDRTLQRGGSERDAGGRGEMQAEIQGGMQGNGGDPGKDAEEDAGRDAGREGRGGIREGMQRGMEGL